MSLNNENNTIFRLQRLMTFEAFFVIISTKN